MRIIVLLAALIFSATASKAYAQSPSLTADPSAKSVQMPMPVPSLKLKIQTPISAGPGVVYAVQNKSIEDLNTRSPPKSSTYTRPDARTRFKRYVNGMVGPYALARQVAGAGIATWRNSPEEWSGQWEGFGKRVVSNLGKNVIKQTAIYGLDEAMQLDSHYYRSEKKDVGSKIKNALLSPVTARNSRGNRVLGVPRLVGTYTASITAAETWFPDRYDWKDGVRNGSISLGFNAAFNLFKEFVWKK